MKKMWIAFALMACLSFAACGSGSSEGDSDSNGDNGGGEPVSPAVGTWVLDGDATVKSFTDTPPEGLPPQAMDPIKQMIAAMKGEMTMNADGTFEGVMEIPNPMTGESKPQSVKGTWTLDGETFSMTTTEQDGKPEETPETQAAVLKDGVMTVSPEGAPFSFLFKEK